MKIKGAALLPLVAATSFQDGNASLRNLGVVEGFACAVECASSLAADFAMEPSRECWACLDDTAKWGAQLPLTYFKDIMPLKLGKGYTDWWCSHAGVDMKANPTGWIQGANGTFSGCQVVKDFPGVGSTSHQSHAFVREEMKKVPKLQNEGSIWRGNELGFIISNELFWPNVNPRSVLLGSTVKQHKVLRPILMRLFSECGASCESKLLQSAQAAQSKASINVQNDIKIWVHEELFKIAFPGKVNPWKASDFVSLQTSFTTLSTITQILPDSVTKLISGSTIKKLQSVYDAYRPLVEQIYGPELANQDCSPSPSCVDQLTSALLDTLLAAGGLSVPGGISTGLWVLHSPSSEFSRVTLAEQDKLAFFYESLRFFAPVVGFPWWTPSPKRASDDTANQYEGGNRVILNLALAGKDPNAWGPDAHQFKVRSLKEYHSKFVGFADFAMDASVANGAMDRVCPGKDLALKFGKAFFSAWKQEEWCTQDTPKYSEATPFVDDFVLFKGKGLGAPCSMFGGNAECCSGSCRPTKWYSFWVPSAYKCTSKLAVSQVQGSSEPAVVQQDDDKPERKVETEVARPVVSGLVVLTALAVLAVRRRKNNKACEKQPVTSMNPLHA